MTAEELKAKLDAQEQKLATLAGVEAELQAKSAELKEAQTNIDNLDASVKEQKAAIEALRVEVKANKAADFKAEFRAALEAQKDTLAAMAAKREGKFGVTLEVKTPGNITTANMPGAILGMQVDTNVHAAVPAGNVFIATFGLRPRTGNKLAWIEGSSESGAAYVGELAQNTAKSDVTIAPKTRLFGKLATLMRISTETEDWFEQLYNYCVNEGVRLIEQKLDAEIYGGDGNDSTATTHIYGLKGQATAFSALAAAAVEKANVADVIMDAVDQVAKEGYNANVAFLSWALYRQVKELKDTAGNYIFDKASGLLNGVRLIPTTKVAATEILVADSSVVEIYAGNSYELEFVRDGEYDAYNVYFRRAAQVKVPTPKKKGLIYVANAATAVAALLKSA